MKQTSYIQIYMPNGRSYVNNEHGEWFPITDSCERSASIMNDDYVRMVFVLPDLVEFAPFSYVEYGDELFFLKESYRPVKNGTVYAYDVKFVSFANMLEKPICYRHVVVVDEEFDEPEINVNANLNTMVDIVFESIAQASNRYSGTKFGEMLSLVSIGTIEPNTQLKTFSFSGSNISDVLTSVANTYETEWWFTYEKNGNDFYPTLNMCKCEVGSGIYLSDDVRSTGSVIKPYESLGLAEPARYAQEWSGVVQTIVPFGSNRNITRNQAVDEITGMMVSYNNRLRLQPNHTYSFMYEGEEVSITTGSHGEVTNGNVSTGIEQVNIYDDIYPQLHFVVTAVNKRGNEDSPKYDIFARGIKINSNDVEHVYTEEELYTDEELHTIGITPLREIIASGETLSLHFESGYLNGMEFELNDKEQKQIGLDAWTIKLTIIPNGDKDEGTQIPNGYFAPRVGDKFALYNIVMPDTDDREINFLTSARLELAIKAYEELLDIEKTRPEVKCVSDKDYFSKYVADGLVLGNRVSLRSSLFSNEVFSSRVISYSHKLTDNLNISFSLASSHVEGRITAMESKIIDQTNDITGLEERSVSISRRGWRDADERSEMINSLASEMMLVGNEKWQFTFTSGIECVNENNRFSMLHVTAGVLQHTQQPYIDYECKGAWDVSEQTINVCVHEGVQQELVDDTPYYVYAILSQSNNVANIILSDIQYSNDIDTDTDYVLIGILSSVFPDNGTYYRVFNRTNGYTSIDGGTLTTEQIQDVNRNLIIDFQSYPPRIIARKEAEIVGNIKFLSADGSKKTINQVIDDMQVGGENLIGETNPLTIPMSETDEYNYAILVGKVSDSLKAVNSQYLENGAKYVFSCGNSETEHFTQEFSAGIFSFGAGIFDIRNYDIGREVSDVFEIPNDGNDYSFIIYAGEFGRTAGVSIVYYNLMLQKGTKSTEYLPYVKHISSAFEGDAKNSSTDIYGGIVMTSLLKLRNSDGNVVSGMSGIKNDNVTMWGGGTYDQAINQETPILLTKNGYGSKIGEFNIEKDGVYIKDKDSNEIVVFTSDSIAERSSASGSTSTVILPRMASTSLVTPREGAINHASSNIGVGTYHVYGSFDLDGYITYKRLPEIGTCYKSINKYKIRVYFGDTIVKEIDYNVKSSLPILLGHSDLWAGRKINEFSHSVELSHNARVSTKIDIDFLIKSDSNNSVIVQLLIDDISGVDYNGEFKCYHTMNQSTITFENMSKETIIARDGIIIRSGSNGFFVVKTSSSGIEVYANGLTEGDPHDPGKLYLNGNYLCVSR